MIVEGLQSPDCGNSLPGVFRDILSHRILIVDDDEDLLEVLTSGFSKQGFEVITCRDADAAQAKLDASNADVVLTDLNMPGTDGIDLCRQLAQSRPDTPVIVMTGYATLESAIAAIRVGAYDYIQKPLHVHATSHRLRRLIEQRALREEVKRLRSALTGAPNITGILGESKPMKGVLQLIERVADSLASVLLTGESGTGKEKVARALHDRSSRRDQPFVPLHCPTLSEADLTGDDSPLLRARGGTLFLEELGRLPLALQPQLLQALERGVAADAEGNALDVRIIAATNIDLDSAVADGAFREDLFFRINVIHIEMPPLRARGNDVLLLAQAFLERVAPLSGKPVRGFQRQAAERMLAYNWPGNIRELHNCVEHAVALTQFNLIGLEDLPAKVRNYRSSHVVVASDNPTELVSMSEVERRYIARVMEAAAGNKSLAAKILGFDRKTLYRKLDRYGLKRNPQAS